MGLSWTAAALTTLIAISLTCEKTQYRLARDRFIASARGVLPRRSPGSVRIVGGTVRFFDRRANRTSPVPPGGREKRQSPLSRSIPPFPPGEQSLHRKKRAGLHTAREWLQIVGDTVEIPPDRGFRPGRQNRPVLRRRIRVVSSDRVSFCRRGHAAEPDDVPCCESLLDISRRMFDKRSRHQNRRRVTVTAAWRSR